MDTKSATKWRPLPLPDDPEEMSFILRQNALGSLFQFASIVLQRDRLSHLHERLAASLESDHVRFVLELPRDHFKTTMVTEALAMWWALPFSEVDELFMRSLGYGDEWIRWMKHAHCPTTRTLIVSESITNAAKLGARIDAHYTSNAIFRSIFPEILPDVTCTWTLESKHQRIPGGFAAQGEGTFDYLGVGGAVQSRHYNRIIEDDIVGKDAMESELVMQGVIRYHQLLAGVFDGPGEEIVVGNRWSPNDLNGHIREHERGFMVESHSALGGCCPDHPVGIPILPEEFTVERLEDLRARLGPFLFEHQYQNHAVMPEECVFRPAWLRYYDPVAAPRSTGVDVSRHWLHHDVEGGQVISDTNPNLLVRSMVVDPAHAEKAGRSRHAIIVTGLDPESDRIYLLDVWVDSRSYDEFLGAVYRLAEKWNLRDFWLETVAAQKYLKYHIEYRNKVEKRVLTVRELHSDHSKNAKRTRIDALSPLFEANRVWVRRDQTAFLDEYFTYPSSRTMDVLDCLGYAPQTWQVVYAKGILTMLKDRRAEFKARRSITGY